MRDDALSNDVEPIGAELGDRLTPIQSVTKLYTSMILVRVPSEVASLPHLEATAGTDGRRQVQIALEG
jgi:hypothetical protein